MVTRATAFDGKLRFQLATCEGLTLFRTCSPLHLSAAFSKCARILVDDVSKVVHAILIHAIHSIFIEIEEVYRKIN